MRLFFCDEGNPFDLQWSKNAGTGYNAAARTTPLGAIKSMKKQSLNPVRWWALASIVAFVVLPMKSHALDLLPNLFDKPEVTATIWEQTEQFVRLVAIEDKAALNNHPIALDPVEVEQALASLQLWTKGGVFRDEQSLPVYPKSQASTIARYLVDALNKASPNEDVIFNIRGYADVLLSVGRERQWTTGRVFYKDGKLNLIVGEYQKRIDKAKKNVEGSFGVAEDFRDVNFDIAGRRSKGHMPGRIVNTAGVEHGEADRADWVAIEVLKAAKAYRDGQTPVAARKEEEKVRNEAAKLTLERREMREEMARMRKELKTLQEGGSSKALPLEERLAKLQKLLDKGLISADDFKQRKAAILDDI